MSSVNKVILVGNLGQDPDVKQTQNGQTVASFSVACSESWTDANGQKKERTEWVNCVAWQKKAELCAQYIKKGSKVYIEGKLQTRQWDDQQGVKHYKTEVIVDNVVFLDSRNQGAAPQEQAPATGPRYEYEQPQQNYQQPPRQQGGYQQQPRQAPQQQRAPQQGGYQQRPQQQRQPMTQPQWSQPQATEDFDVPF